MVRSLEALTVAYKPTSAQIGIMRHALGISQGTKEYRNHYVAGEGHQDWQDLLILETELLIRRVKTPGWMHKKYDIADDIVFMVTNEGKHLCKGVKQR